VEDLEEELIAGGVPEYDRPGNRLITRFFKGGEKGAKPPASGLPWPRPGGGPKVGDGGAGPGGAKAKKRPALPEAEAEEKETVSRLRKELADLKQHFRKQRLRKERKKRRSGKEQVLEVRLLLMKAGRKRKGKRRDPLTKGA